MSNITFEHTDPIAYEYFESRWNAYLINGCPGLDPDIADFIKLLATHPSLVPVWSCSGHDGDHVGYFVVAVKDEAGLTFIHSLCIDLMSARMGSYLTYESAPVTLNHGLALGDTYRKESGVALWTGWMFKIRNIGLSRTMGSPHAPDEFVSVEKDLSEIPWFWSQCVVKLMSALGLV